MTAAPSTSIGRRQRGLHRVRLIVVHLFAQADIDRKAATFPPNPDVNRQDPPSAAAAWICPEVRGATGARLQAAGQAGEANGARDDRAAPGTSAGTRQPALNHHRVSLPPSPGGNDTRSCTRHTAGTTESAEVSSLLARAGPTGQARPDAAPVSGAVRGSRQPGRCSRGRDGRRRRALMLSPRECNGRPAARRRSAPARLGQVSRSSTWGRRTSHTRLSSCSGRLAVLGERISMAQPAPHR